MKSLGLMDTEMYLLLQDWVDHRGIKFANKIEIRKKPWVKPTLRMYIYAMHLCAYSSPFHVHYFFSRNVLCFFFSCQSPIIFENWSLSFTLLIKLALLPPYFSVSLLSCYKYIQQLRGNIWFFSICMCVSFVLTAKF